MDQHVLLIVQSIASVLSGILVLAALFLLWSKSQSSWLLLALLGEAVSLLFRFAVAVAPSVLGGIKPNISAPGVNVRSSVPNNAYCVAV